MEISPVMCAGEKNIPGKVAKEDGVIYNKAGDRKKKSHAQKSNKGKREILYEKKKFIMDLCLYAAAFGSRRGNLPFW